LGYHILVFAHFVKSKNMMKEHGVYIDMGCVMGRMRNLSIVLTKKLIVMESKNNAMDQTCLF
jgi:hypothetical protein